MDKKLAYLNNISEYLTELSYFLKNSVKKYDLASPTESEKIKKSARSIDDLKNKKFKLLFSEKKGKRFNDYIKSLYFLNSSTVYIWTPRTNYCGAYEINGIDKININFPFDANKEGIVVFFTKDLKDKILLDFTKNNDGIEIVEIEVTGNNWINSSY